MPAPTALPAGATWLVALAASCDVATSKRFEVRSTSRNSAHTLTKWATIIAAMANNQPGPRVKVRPRWRYTLDEDR